MKRPTASIVMVLLAGVCLTGCGGGDPINLDTDSGTDSDTDNCAADYGLIFPENEIVLFEIDMASSDWQIIVDEASIPMDQASPETYVPATVTFKGEVYENVGVRSKGHGTRDPNKPSLKLHFSKFVDGQRFHCLKKINLTNMAGDSSMMREKIVYGLFESVGAPASRVGYAELIVNGESYGLYANIEQVDKTFLTDRLGENDGNLYKLYYGSFLQYKGPNIEDYLVTAWGGVTQLELKTNKQEADYSDILNLMDVLTNTPASQVEQEVSAVVDVGEILDTLSVYTLLGSFDWYGNEGNNYYLYRRDDGRFIFIPWDLDGSLRGLGEDVCRPWASYTEGGKRVLYESIFESSTYRADYEARLGALLASGYSASQLDAKIDTVYQFIRDAAHADTHKPYDNTEFDAEAQAVKSFVASRRDQASAVIATPGACDDITTCNSGSCGEPIDPLCVAWCDCYVGCMGENDDEAFCTNWCNGD